MEGSSSTKALSGAYAGLITRLICQPLDVLKIRFQLQEEPIKTGGPTHSGPTGNASTSSQIQSGKYQGLRQALSLMIKEEGPTALWKGHVPAQALSILYGAVYFGTIELTREVLQDSFFSPLQRDFISGNTGGLAATVAAHPFDVLRTRLVGQWEHARVYSNLRSGAQQMLREEGVRGFYRGLGPALLGAAPQAGLSYAAYRGVGRTLETAQLLEEKSRSLVSGAMAGAISKGIMCPLDVIKKRLQVMGFEKARIHFGKVLLNYLYLLLTSILRLVLI